MSRLLMQVFTSPLTWLVLSGSASRVKLELVKVKKRKAQLSRRSQDCLTVKSSLPSGPVFRPTRLPKNGSGQSKLTNVFSLSWPGNRSLLGGWQQPYLLVMATS